jgi:hypothetical protein
MSTPTDNLQPLLDRIDLHGYCIVWDLAGQRWKRLAGLDARQQYEAGLVVLEDPAGSLPPPEMVAKSEWPRGASR